VKPEVTQVLSLSEALTSLRRTYLGSFLLDPEDSRKLSIGDIWRLVEGIGGHLEIQWGFGAPLIDMGHKGPVKAYVHWGREVPNPKYNQSINQSCKIVTSERG
jgi:hypothetical protein